MGALEIQRPVSFNTASGSRAPVILIFEAAFSIALKSSGVNSTEAAGRISSFRQLTNAP